MKIKYFPEILNYVLHDLTSMMEKKVFFLPTGNHQILNCLFTTLYMCTQSVTINVIHRTRKSLVGKNAYTTSLQNEVYNTYSHIRTSVHQTCEVWIMIFPLGLWIPLHTRNKKQKKKKLHQQYRFFANLHTIEIRIVVKDKQHNKHRVLWTPKWKIEAKILCSVSLVSYVKNKRWPSLFWNS